MIGGWLHIVYTDGDVEIIPRLEVYRHGGWDRECLCYPHMRPSLVNGHWRWTMVHQPFKEGK